MRIGVISDTHITDKSQELPKKISEVFKGVDLIIHAGDLADLTVIEKLKKICPDVRAVWGNMDPQEVRTQLPEREIIKVNNHSIGLMHGRGAPANLIELLSSEFKNDPVDIVIFGHSHAGLNKSINGILYFNPGSPTDKVYAKENTVGIIEINGRIEAKLIKL